MAGRGPAPKESGKRVRRNADVVPLRSLQAVPVVQPELTSLLGEVNPATGNPWTIATLELWSSLGEFPSTAGLMRAQWALLARAMVLDDLVMSGEVKHASEVRLEIAKFFIAPDDLLRGRIVLAAAEEADERRATPRSAARARRGPLTSAG